jgi:hypothetical protein
MDREMSPSVRSEEDTITLRANSSNASFTKVEADLTKRTLRAVST